MRFHDLIRAATGVFIARRGFRRTQMDDVAAAMGVSKGSLYLLVDGKQALFDLLVRHADHPESFRPPATLPVTAPPPEATLRFLGGRLARNKGFRALLQALRRPETEDPGAELRGIVGGLYDELSANRRAIKLIDTAATDYPALAELWFRRARHAFMGRLVPYIERRTAQGCFAPPPDTPIAARNLIETCVFWAIHRHWDPEPQPVNETAVRACVVNGLSRALLARPDQILDTRKEDKAV